MSSSQHPDATPQECARCRQTEAKLRADSEAGHRPTNAEIGAVIGLKNERSVRLHVANLIQHGWLDADGRTPIPRKDDDSTSLGWARSRPVVHAVDGKMMRALGKLGWSGSITNATWAAAAGVSLRTVANHRPHLGPWVELTIGRSQDKAGRLVRQASTFRLIEWIRLTPVIRPIREGGDLFDRKAVDLLEQVEYLRSEHLQDLRLRSLVARALREGMPFQSLLERLTTNVPPVHRIVSGPDFLEARVPASGAEVPISARLAVELDARTKRAAIPRPTPVAVAETVPVASRRAALQRWCEGRDGRCHAPIPDDTWGNLCRACAHELSRIGA